MYYNIQGDRIVKVAASEWRFGTEEDRRVSYDKVDDFTVSTVFLGIDHNFANEGPPLIFETAVFHTLNNWGEVYAERYPTWIDAVNGHQRAIAWIKSNGQEILAEHLQLNKFQSYTPKKEITA